MSKTKKQAVLSLSGGLDSSTLLLHLLKEGYQVTALSFDYGQKHKIELERATDLIKYINFNQYQVPADRAPDGWSRNYYKVKHQIIRLEGLSSLLNSTLVEGGEEVPEGHYQEYNMKETVVPNRNKIFSSIIQAVALSQTGKDLGNGIQEHRDVKIALGIHSGDHTIYPDTTEAFRDADYAAFLEGNWGGELVQYYTPYLETDKFGILQDGEKCCEKLGLDFNEVYKRTITSYKPIFIKGLESRSRVEEALRTSFGEWFSDYKSSSSIERIEAFIKLGRPDPISYANSEGPVEWNVAKQHVLKVLKERDGSL